MLSLSWYLLVQLLLLTLKFSFWNCRETRSYFESRPKTVNIHGYSELREPIRTRENYYPLIWWILILVIVNPSSPLNVFFFSAIAAITAIVAITWKPGFNYLPWYRIREITCEWQNYSLVSNKYVSHWLPSIISNIINNKNNLWKTAAQQVFTLSLSSFCICCAIYKMYTFFFVWAVIL